ncbi:unnamed protein product [Clonostachys rosea]|uniref:6-phosphogluconate dehydrogenase NADP-binding domain-containing protein n=1 Tax=Bionectria ochroleuca TaxID=29856 RepID=A0ABY6TWF8_BIOOC|nr:unnamed protein product [Clonostachys rosea]
MSASRVLFLGLGNMGAALAKTLQTTLDQPILLWNRTKERPVIQDLVQNGATFHQDVLLAVKQAEIIVICVLNYSTLHSILDPLNDNTVFVGKTIINLTNGTLKDATEAEKWMKSHGVSLYFDGAVMVTPQLVGTSQSLILYSGESKESFDANIAKLVEPLGLAAYTGPDVASAAANDLAALSAMYGMFAGFFTGIGLLKKQAANSGAGGKIKTRVDTVMVPVLTAMVPYLSLLAQTIDDESYDENAGSPIGMQLVGLRNILKACKEEGVNPSGLDALGPLMQRVVDSRGPDGSVAEVARFTREAI